MAVNKLQALTTFLVSQNMCDENQIDSWMQDGKMVPTSKSKGAGIVICRIEYDALVVFSRFSGDGNKLMALVCAWLIDNDDSREDENLPPPNIDIEILDARTADIEINVTFRENIELVETENGDIPLNGRSWSVSSAPIYVVDEVAVGNDQTKPTDANYLHVSEE